MARRNPDHPNVRPRPGPSPRAEGPEEDGVAAFADRLGEWLRRAALGLTAALITARAFWPSEPDFQSEAGNGLDWVLALLLAAGLAVASALVGGALRIRWSWTDAAVVTLMVLVGLSASQALDRRPAINLAWEWAALGVAYVLVRNLPRTSGESAALVGALAATAVAVSVFGLYQVGVELPEIRAFYRRHPLEARWRAGVVSEASVPALENRLLWSNEPWSTFALANSLAGYLVGPLLVMLAFCWEGLRSREGRRARLPALFLAVLPVLAVVVCLLLTKSRSAYIGLAVGMTVLAWRERLRVRARTLALGALGGLAVLAVLVVAGAATGRLDRQVITESAKSLGYRRQYWVGAWRVITEGPRTFWTGHGPGNFADPYVRHKLPEASEEIKDPHNLVLEVWATAGAWAVLALVAALGLGLWNLLGPASPRLPPGADARTEPPLPSSPRAEPPRRAGWLLACAGGGWLLATPLFVGQLDPFTFFDRWLILGGTWALAVALGLPLWRRIPLDGAWLGAAVLAVLVNLLAAGGIGIPTVALALWTTLALGLNLRVDRPCGRLRIGGGRLPAFGLALVWSALLGSFAGAIEPYWESEQALAEARAALEARPPQFDQAEDALRRARLADKYNPHPWLYQARLDALAWEARGARVDDKRWQKVPVSLLKAATWPRNPNSWTLHHERALVTRDLIRRLGPNLKPAELLRYRANVVEATRRATQLYPTNASLHAELAQASAEIGMFPDAVHEAREALRLDDLMPHQDKKLPHALRAWLEKQLPIWEQSAQNARSEPK